MNLEEKLLQEIENLKIELDKAKKAANENDRYRAIVENRVNRNAKDSVFVDLFSYPEYQMQIYRELFPDDTEILPEDVELFRIDRVLTNHPFNDLGILVRRKLIVLAEAESDWSENVIYRLAEYYFQTQQQFINETGMNVHHRAKIDLLDVEAFVIYPGKEEINRDRLSLRELYFDGNPDKPDFIAKVIHGDYKGGIIAEYMGFCRVLDEQRKIHKNDEAPQKWIDATVEICIEKGFLAKYLTSHRTEVEQIMFEMYNPKYVEEREQKSRTYEETISVLREVNTPEDKIKELLVQRYGLTDVYAQNLLDCKPSHNTVMAV